MPSDESRVTNHESRTPILTILLLAVPIAAGLLVACGASEKRIAFNRYVLEIPYGDDRPYPEAVATLEDEATDICEQGYRKVHDYDTLRGSERVLVWEITCEGVSRGEQPGTTVTPLPK